MKLEKINQTFKRYDYSFFALASVIFFLGILNLYSATYTDMKMEMVQAQLLKFLLALIMGGLISVVHPKTYFRYSYLIYAINIFLLIFVLLIGKTALGARRWIEFGGIRFQPSEMMKFSLILALGRWFTQENPEAEMGLKDLIVPGILSFVPAAMIIAQPDLGTGMILIFVFLMMCFYRRLKWKSIAIIVLLGSLSGVLMYNFALKEYQRNRIRTFLNPQVDAKGTGYNAIQSVIAIGSGQLIGKGFKNSSQASLSYLPENHTDFVFSVYNEEHGFIGSIVLISLYVFLFVRFIWLASSVLKVFDSILTIGIFSIFFFHTLINMGMVTGVLPIVGLPLPLMSHGGSSLLTSGICLGMITSISNSKNFFYPTN